MLNARAHNRVFKAVKVLINSISWHHLDGKIYLSELFKEQLFAILRSTWTNVEDFCRINTQAVTWPFVACLKYPPKIV